MTAPEAAVLARMCRPDAALQPHLEPYLNQLPTPDVPLLWPPPLRAALLRGTSAGPAAESQAALSAKMMSKMTTVIGELVILSTIIKYFAYEGPAAQARSQ